MQSWNIAIVGGGPGGLMTAYALQKFADCDLRITLFEASDRLGGKLRTPCFRFAPVRYEAGAAEFYDYSQFDDDPLKLLVAELGLSISPMAGSAVIANHQVIANLDDVRDRLGRGTHDALMRFDLQARDLMTRHEFYESDHPDGAGGELGPSRFDTLLAQIDDPMARRYVECLVHSDLATEPCRTNIGYGLQNYLMNDTRYMHLYSIEGGNEQLAEALIARIGATVLLNHPVHRIDPVDSGKWSVHSQNNADRRQGDFDYVVLALPHNQLPSIGFGSRKLAAAVRRHHDYYNAPAHYLRVTVLFDRPFWRGELKDSFWMLDHFGGCCLYDESSREPESAYGVLGWLLGGAAAEEMSALDDDTLVDKALESLPAFLASGRHHFLEGHVHRWPCAVNAMPGGEQPLRLDQRHQPGPDEHPGLMLVGDYLFDSTLNGVLDSANYVATWLAANMADAATQDKQGI